MESIGVNNGIVDIKYYYVSYYDHDRGAPYGHMYQDKKGNMHPLDWIKKENAEYIGPPPLELKMYKEVTEKEYENWFGDGAYGTVGCPW